MSPSTSRLSNDGSRPRSRTIGEGSFRRSPSTSNGGSPFKEIPAVLTRLTVASERGRRSGVHRAVSRWARAMRDCTILVDAGLKYLYESTRRVVELIALV